MNKEIENLIKKIMARDIELAMLKKEEAGLIINKEEVLEILEELCPKEEPKENLSNCCGAKMTEPDSSGLATCYKCKEGCVVEDPEEEKFLAENVEETGEMTDTELAMEKGANPNNY